MRTSELMCSCQEQTAHEQASGRRYEFVLLVVRCLQSSYIQTLEAVCSPMFSIMERLRREAHSRQIRLRMRCTRFGERGNASVCIVYPLVQAHQYLRTETRTTSLAQPAVHVGDVGASANRRQGAQRIATMKNNPLPHPERTITLFSRTSYQESRPRSRCDSLLMTSLARPAYNSGWRHQGDVPVYMPLQRPQNPFGQTLFNFSFNWRLPVA